YHFADAKQPAGHDTGIREPGTDSGRSRNAAERRVLAGRAGLRAFDRAETVPPEESHIPRDRARDLRRATDAPQRGSHTARIRDGRRQWAICFELVERGFAGGVASRASRRCGRNSIEGAGEGSAATIRICRRVQRGRAALPERRVSEGEAARQAVLRLETFAA